MQQIHAPLLLFALLTLPALAAQDAKPAADNDPVTGLVVSSDGNPVPAANLLFVSSTPDEDGEYRPVQGTTDDKGEFSFPRTKRGYWILAKADAGSAEIHVNADQRPGKHRLTLRPWGRIQGILLRGQKPLADETVTCWSTSNPTEGPRIQFRGDARTDAEGRFTIERIPPGTHDVVHMVFHRIGRGRMFMPTHTVVATIEPGKTTNVTIGGTGRPITGKFTSDQNIDWPRVHAMLSHQRKDGGQKREYVIWIEPDGAFRADDIPEGTYELKLAPFPPYPRNPDGQHPRFAAELTQVQVPAMEGGRSDQPLDLGRLNVRLLPPEPEPKP